MQKVHVKNFFRENSQKIDKKIDVTFSSTFLVLSRFQVFLGDGSSQTLQKTFYITRQKNPKTGCFSNFFYHVFGRFSVLGEGSAKTRKKNLGKKSDQPWYFFGLRGTNQPPQGPSLFFLSAP
jgi:hypothetical protein